MNNVKKTKNGYTLVETIFYVSLFAIVSFILLDVLMKMTDLFINTAVRADIVQGSKILENISRELKQGENFTFSSNILTVNTRDEYGNPRTVVYTLSGTNIGINDSVLGNLGNLNTPNISVVSFDIDSINTLQSKAAKIYLSIRSNRDVVANVENFQNTIVLRGSY